QSSPGSASDTTAAALDPALDAAPAVPALHHFLGTWAYDDGSGFSITCGDQVVFVQDLFRAGNEGEPASFTFTAPADGRPHEPDGLGCQYNFAVTGADAVAPAGQTCDRLPDGHGAF